jgi:hypothetical protein
MAIPHPFRRTCRPFLNGDYFEGGTGEYVTHPRFAVSPEHYIRAYLLILKDLLEVFDYIEPADDVKCHLYRIHALFLRTCVEVEANCKAILAENGYRKPGNMGIYDYSKIEVTHHLSAFQVKVPYWGSINAIRTPFLNWSIGKSLCWYQDYNSIKHDRYTEFSKASFINLVDAFCGLLVILTAQFADYDFSPGNNSLSVGYSGDGMNFGIGGYFHVKYPNNFLDNDCYDFIWEDLQGELDPFQNHDYKTIPPQQHS